MDIDLQFGDAAGMLHVERHLLSIADLRSTATTSSRHCSTTCSPRGPPRCAYCAPPSSPELSEMVAASTLRSIIRRRSQSARIRRRRHAVAARRAHAGGLRAGRSCPARHAATISAPVRGTKATIAPPRSPRGRQGRRRRGPQSHAPARELPPRGHRDDPWPEHPRRSSVRPTGGSVARFRERRSSWLAAARRAGRAV